MGFVSPLIVAALVEGNQTIKAWRNVYIIAGMVSLFFAFVWSILGSADLQSWNTYWDDLAKNDIKNKSDNASDVPVIEGKQIKT